MGERRREEKGGNYLVAALEIFFKVVIKNLKLKILIKIELKYINIKKKKKIHAESLFRLLKQIV